MPVTGSGRSRALGLQKQPRSPCPDDLPPRRTRASVPTQASVSSADGFQDVRASVPRQEPSLPYHDIGDHAGASPRDRQGQGWRQRAIALGYGYSAVPLGTTTKPVTGKWSPSPLAQLLVLTPLWPCSWLNLPHQLLSEATRPREA